MERKYCACCGCYKARDLFSGSFKTCDRCRERQKKKDQRKRLKNAADKQQKEIEEGEKQYCSHCKMNRKIGLFSENHKTCDLCRDKMKIYSQTWRDNHKEEISEINKDCGMKICVCSVCDCQVRLKHKARHEKIKKHIDNLKKDEVEDN